MKNQAMSLKGLRNAHFSSVIGKRGLFRDGDWVESKDQDLTGDVRLVQLADIGEGVYLNKSARFLTSSKAKELRCTFLHLGDLLVARMPDPIGRACVFPGDPKPCVTAVDVCIVRPDPELVDVQWLKWATNSPEFRFHLGRFTAGTTRKRISRKNLEQIPLKIPPLPEQRRIAAILDKANTIRRKRQESILLMEEFLRSAFLDIFGDPVTNPKRWEVRNLDEIVDSKNGIVDGPFGSSINTKVDYVSNGEVPVIRTKNVRNFEFVTEDLKFITREKFKTVIRSRVIPGDIILTKVGTIGNVCIFPDTFPEAVLSTTGSCKITPNVKVVTREYLLYYLHFYKSEMLRMSSQGVQGFLNLSHIKSFKVPVPPLSLQNKFVSEINSINSAKKTFSIANIHLDQLFDSLAQRAFRGEL